jgi:ABC-type glutathione transport system ATPase component
MTFLVLQCLNGLSYATTLFLMAAGLTLIFGVTRIVNFAQGSFFMPNRRCLRRYHGHRLSGQMSGGEQQMLAIARTLMTAPTG